MPKYLGLFFTKNDLSLFFIKNDLGNFFYVKAYILKLQMCIYEQKYILQK